MVGLTQEIEGVTLKLHLSKEEMKIVIEEDFDTYMQTMEEVKVIQAA